MIAAQSFTLSTTPTLIATGVPEGKVVLLRDPSADIFIGGGTGVTSSNGFKVATTDVISITLFQGDALFAVASTGTPTVRALCTRTATSSAVA